MLEELDPILRTKLHVDSEALEDVAEEWDHLLSRSSIRTVFLYPVWHQVWLRSFQNGRDFRLYTVRDGEQLLGVAPFLVGNGQVAFSGDPDNCDYMDFIVSKGMEASVLSSLFEELATGSWQTMHLWGVPAASPTLRILPAVAEAARFEVTLEVETLCPRVPLPATWDAYLARLTKKDRHELRRKLRRLSESGAKIDYYALTTPDEIASSMDDFLRLMELSRHDKAEFLTPQMEHFFRTMAVTLAGRGLVRLYFLELDSVRVASVLCFDCNNEILMYNSGFDPSLGHLAVGLISKALVIKDAIEQGRAVLDFLRGTERYKYDLGAQNVQVYRCMVTRR